MNEHYTAKYLGDADDDGMYEGLQRRGEEDYFATLTEPEDRTFGRDLKPVVAELNALASRLEEATRLLLLVQPSVEGRSHGWDACVCAQCKLAHEVKAFLSPRETPAQEESR